MVLGRVLSTKGHEQSHAPLSEDDADVPEEIESVLEDIFPGLQDRVRYSEIYRILISPHTVAHTGYDRSMGFCQGSCTHFGAITSRVYRSSRRHCNQPFHHPFRWRCIPL